MATNTKNFNFKKPDESDFYSIQDQNGNWDLADEELQKLNEPACEDYTTGTSVPPAATALEALKSKIKLPVWMSNVVAFCKGCCTLAMIVNNCVSSDADKPLAAAQGKALQDQLTKLYSDLKTLKKADVQFSNGFTEISFPGITYTSNVCITQEYRSSDGVQNLVFTAQVRPNELIIYARNAGDGSSDNGILNIMVIAIG